MEKSAIKIFIITLLGVFSLSGCGGSDGADKALAKAGDKTTTTDNSGKAVQPPATNLKVTAIDGYLKGAVVFLDINDNQKLDADEPQSSIGSDKGIYNLSIPNNIYSSKHKVIVNVIAGKTIDMDTPSVTAPKSYSMSAPKGRTIVTPITTLVAFKMQSEAISEEEAATSVARSLGLPDGFTLSDLLGDYMAKTDQNSQQLRLIAKKVAQNSELISKLVDHDQMTDSKVDALDRQLQELAQVIEAQRIAIEELAKEKIEGAENRLNTGGQSITNTVTKVALQIPVRPDSIPYALTPVKPPLAPSRPESIPVIAPTAIKQETPSKAVVVVPSKLKQLPQEVPVISPTELVPLVNQAEINQTKDFVFTVGVNSSLEFKINNPQSTSRYSIDCDDGDASIAPTETIGTYICQYHIKGEYVIRIKDKSATKDALSSLSFADSKIIDVMQWGDEKWDSFYSFFKRSTLKIISAKDSPNTLNVTDMRHMFDYAISFNGDISNWDTSSVTDMSHMFFNAKVFNQDLSHWNTSSVTDMSYMFYGSAAFNRDLSKWDTSSVANMSHTFFYAEAFNQDLSNWNTFYVTDMSRMFAYAESFNQDLSKWDTSAVTDMGSMFRLTNSFNGDISKWDTSSVTDMSGIFDGAYHFNGDISKWDTSSVTDMSRMFRYADSFNGDISNWDTSSVTNMDHMFNGADSFNRDLSKWDISSVTSMDRIFSYPTLMTYEHKPHTTH